MLQGVPMTVKVLEKLVLSSQYTPELFFDAYKSSMSLELKNYSILVFNIFRNAVITFPENQSDASGTAIHGSGKEQRRGTNRLY